MDASELLRRGADYIDEHGWQRGTWGYPGGPCCAIGSMNVCIGVETGITQAVGFPDRGVVAEAVVRLHDHLGLNAPHQDAFSYGNAVADWNDGSGMTAHEVTAAMRAAADAD
ncbi:hypothetical protein SEA_SHAGRAT_66 [Rhodococcus phage Shagrat]|nr:hypothetical protein SEA_SHAGRAT_66 [Rhodococcus phage Shagrat]